MLSEAPPFRIVTLQVQRLVCVDTWYQHKLVCTQTNALTSVVLIPKLVCTKQNAQKSFFVCLPIMKNTKTALLTDKVLL